MITDYMTLKLSYFNLKKKKKHYFVLISTRQAVVLLKSQTVFIYFISVLLLGRFVSALLLL